MDLTVKIQNLEQKIKNYKAKYPKRSPQQTSKLNHLWLELLFWELVQKGEIELPNYLLKIEKSWEHLKEIYRVKGKWPRKELQEFLKKQKPEYAKCLIWIIEQDTIVKGQGVEWNKVCPLQTNPEYLKFTNYLKKLTTH